MGAPWSKREDREHGLEVGGEGNRRFRAQDADTLGGASENRGTLSGVRAAESQGRLQRMAVRNMEEDKEHAANTPSVGSVSK